MKVYRLPTFVLRAVALQLIEPNFLPAFERVPEFDLSAASLLPDFEQVFEGPPNTLFKMLLALEVAVFLDIFFAITLLPIYRPYGTYMDFFRFKINYPPIGFPFPPGAPLSATAVCFSSVTGTGGITLFG